MNGGYLPIGRFARLCRLSVKQLRNYDELGLLAPAHVDPDSGYRYYRPGQAREALLIGLLRSLDVPLAEVGRVLPARTGCSAAYATVWRPTSRGEGAPSRHSIGYSPTGYRGRM